MTISRSALQMGDLRLMQQEKLADVKMIREAQLSEGHSVCAGADKFKIKMFYLSGEYGEFLRVYGRGTGSGMHL